MPLSRGILVAEMTHVMHRTRWSVRLLIFASLCLFGFASAQAEEGYGFLRQVEGQVDLVKGTAGTSIDPTINYPIRVGDQLRVAQGGRLEAVLPDGGLLRMGGNSEIRLGRLAQSGDRQDSATLIHLIQGQLQIELTAAAPTVHELRIDTANASVYLLTSGSYRVFSDGKTWTQILVRSGLARVVTEERSTVVETGQQALVDGVRSPQVLVEAAAPRNSLEIWADRLTMEGTTEFRRGYVAPSLAYVAAPLAHHGSWVEVGPRRAWRPRVAAGWRPYHSGWWVYTPSGLTWVSTEPWGWVTYHYGSWENASGIGWVWHPGRTFTPGAVYWYWGPNYVGWIPAGPYSSYYRDPVYALPPYGYFGGIQRFGPYRYDLNRYRWTGLGDHSGTDTAGWGDWTFCRYDRFGYRDSHRHLIRGAELAARGVLESEIPDGIVTTETRGLTPDLWESPERLLDELRRPRASRVNARVSLSRLGTVALEGSSRPGPEARRWNADAWRRENSSLSSEVSPFRRDSRFSRTLPYRGTTSGWPSRTLGGRYGPNRAGSGSNNLLRPSQPGSGSRILSTPSRRSSSGGSRPATRSPSTRGNQSNRSGGMSGTSRPGRPNGGPG
jgi:hypothetical protein